MLSCDAASPDWAQLPSCVLLRVFGSLQLVDLCNASQVCSQWHLVTGAEALWSGLLQQHHGLTKPLSPATCCRTALMQLSTASLHAAGNFAAVISRRMAVGPLSAVHHPLQGRATELSCLWSSRAGRQGQAEESAADGAAAKQPTHDTSSLPGLNRYCSLSPSFAVTAAVAGRSHLVVLGCTGQVIDSRAAFPPHGAPPAAPTAPQPAAAAPAGPEEAQQQAGAAAPQQSLTFLSPWQPDFGVVINSIAAGEGDQGALCGCGPQPGCVHQEHIFRWEHFNACLPALILPLYWIITRPANWCYQQPMLFQQNAAPLLASVK